MSSRSLQALPVQLAHYNFSRPTRIPKEDNKCICCWRAFNKIEDVRDPTERPCRPIRIKPCNHLIGSVCLGELIQRNRAACPHCAAPLTATSSVPQWLIYVLSWDDLFLSPTRWLTSAGEIVLHYETTSIPIFERLHDQVVEGALTIHGALQLWRLYMLSPVVDTRLALLFFFWRHCFFTSRDRLFDMLLSSEYTLVHDVLGQNVQVFNWRFGIGNILDPIYVYLLFKADILDLSNASLCYMVWVAAQYLSWKVMGALLVAQIMMHGGLVAYSAG
jgi:hypothetical protein